MWSIISRVWDAQKAGKLRDLFEDTLAYEFAKYYKSNPDVFSECHILNGGDCLDEPETKLKSLEDSKAALAFIRYVSFLFFFFLKFSQNCDNDWLFFNIRRVRHDIEVKAVRKTLEKVIAKKLVSELASLDLEDSIDAAKKLIEGNALKGKVKYDR